MTKQCVVMQLNTMLSSHSATLCTPYAKGNELFLDGAKISEQHFFAIIVQICCEKSFCLYQLLVFQVPAQKNWENNQQTLGMSGKWDKSIFRKLKV